MYRSRPRRSFKPSAGPPAWLVFLLGAGLVFGLYYLGQGVQNFFRTGGLGVVETTQRAVIVSTATAERVTRAVAADVTTRPTSTPIPECQTFVVNVPNAIVRETPNQNGAIVTSFNQGAEICVLEHNADTGWYTVDGDPETRRPELAYMHETVIDAVNPTPTPSITPTPLPTVTPTLTPPPSPTSAVQPSNTPNPQTPTATPTPAPTLTPSPTPLRQVA